MSRSSTSLLFLILCIACPSAKALDIITATVTVTNTAGTTNGQTLTVNSDARTWTNSVQVPGAQILTNNLIGGAATNLFNEVSTYPFSGLNLAHSGTNGITLQTAPGGPLSVSLSAGWGAVVLTTNTLTDFTVVEVPLGVYPAAQQTNVASGVVAMVAANQATNAIPESAPAVQNLVGITNVQTVTGNKAFTGASNFHAGPYLSSPIETNAVNYGNPFRSPGSAANSEQFGTAALANNTDTVALGHTAHATGPQATAIGKNATSSIDDATSLGYTATASGIDSIAVGAFTAASANNSTAIGFNAIAGWNNSTAIGQNAATSRTNQIGMGTPSTQTWVPGTLQVDGGSAFGAPLTNVTFSGTNSFPAGSDIAFGRYALSSLANGNNAAIVVGTNVFIEVSGPSGAFTINGIAGGRDGKEIKIYNNTGQNMTVAHESGVDPTAANRIRTMTDADRATTGNGFVTLIYSGSASRWIEENFNP